MDAKGEVLLTIMDSLAQQENQSLSQNVKLGLQYRYQQGKVQVNHNRFMGYTKDEDGILTAAGKQRWRPETIKKILLNEKYIGDALLQKTFTVDFLTKKRVKNEDHVPQYYVENSHEAIIPKELFSMNSKRFHNLLLRIEK